jgi:hypothetical protein
MFLCFFSLVKIRMSDAPGYALFSALAESGSIKTSNEDTMFWRLSPVQKYHMFDSWL